MDAIEIEIEIVGPSPSSPTVLCNIRGQNAGQHQDYQVAV
jgi:hypothetical protein